MIAIAIRRSAGGRSPERVLTVPATLTEIGAREWRGSALGAMPPLNLTKRSPCAVSSAWASEAPSAKTAIAIASAPSLFVPPLIPDPG